MVLILHPTYILQISGHILPWHQSTLKTMRPHLLRVQHHPGCATHPGPSAIPTSSIAELPRSHGKPRPLQLQPQVGRGTCPEKVPGFCCGPRAASTDLHKDSHIRPSARMPLAKAVSPSREPCRASSLCPRSAGTDASSSPAPPWQLRPPQGGE